MQEIKPEDVERLIREGKLHFGDELEFQVMDGGSEWTKPIPLRGFAEDGFRPKNKNAKFHAPGGWYYGARVPRPDLRDGDPICVSDRSGTRKRHFKEFGEKSGVRVYNVGTTRWTCDEKVSYWPRWRIPTRDELSEAGLDPNWYEGRRGIKNG
jgi:hypothetical protein